MSTRSSSPESDSSAPLDSMIHTMLLVWPVAIALACLWVLLTAQPAQ